MQRQNIGITFLNDKRSSWRFQQLYAHSWISQSTAIVVIPIILCNDTDWTILITSDFVKKFC